MFITLISFFTEQLNKIYTLYIERKQTERLDMNLNLIIQNFLSQKKVTQI